MEQQNRTEANDSLKGISRWLHFFVLPFRYEKPSSFLKDSGEARQYKGLGLGGAPGRAPQQVKRSENMWGTLMRIWSYLAQYRVRLIAVLVMIVIATGMTLLGPYLIGHIVDHYIVESKDGLLFMLLLTAAVYVVQAISAWLQNIWMIQVSQQTVYKLRTDLFAQFHRLPIAFFTKRQQGDLMSRASNDIENISSSMNSSFIQVFSSTLTLIGIVVVMLSLSPLLTLLTFTVIPLMFMGMKWISNRTSRLFRMQQRSIGALNGFVEETLSGQKIIKAFGQEEEVIKGFTSRNENIRLAGFWAQAISGFIPKLMNGLNSLSFALIVGVGALMTIWTDSVTVGIIIIFAEYARQFTRPLNDLANQWNTLLSAIAGAERVFQILDEPLEVQDESNAKPLTSVVGDVEFHNVNFHYDQGQPIIQHASFQVKAGEMVAFVGPTGAGKTTLISLLSRFYEPSSGAILIDGQNIAQYTRESLRSHMAFVLQDPYLSEGTIMENIRYGRLNATDEEVYEAARLANAHSFIMRLKDGYQTELKLGGVGISQGQKQLIAIARALIADPAILILDEATSSIDTVTEIKIQEALQRLMKGRTSFVIAHRLNTITQANKIIVLEKGKISQIGSHEELSQQEGLYRKLVQGQVVLEA